MRLTIGTPVGRHDGRDVYQVSISSDPMDVGRDIVDRFVRDIIGCFALCSDRANSDFEFRALMLNPRRTGFLLRVEAPPVENPATLTIGRIIGVHEGRAVWEIGISDHAEDLDCQLTGRLVLDLMQTYGLWGTREGDYEFLSLQAYANDAGYFIAIEEPPKPEPEPEQPSESVD